MNVPKINYNNNGIQSDNNKNNYNIPNVNFQNQDNFKNNN